MNPNPMFVIQIILKFHSSFGTLYFAFMRGALVFFYMTLEEIIG